MAFRRWILLLIVAVAGLQTPALRSFAKPPDLPVDQRVRCPEEENERLAAEESWPITSELRQEAAEGRIAACTRDRGDGTVCRGAHDQRAVQAAAWFVFAERCRALGDCERARTAYEEVHLLSPCSRLGAQAIRRLGEIEMMNRVPREPGGEELEVPKPARQPAGDAHREMLRKTQPLGAVPFSMIRADK